MTKDKEKSKEATRCENEKKFYIDNIKRLNEQMASLNEWSIAVIEERLSKLRIDFKGAENKIKQILCGESTSEAKKSVQKEFAECEALMYELVSKLKKRIDEMSLASNKAKLDMEEISLTPSNAEIGMNAILATPNNPEAEKKQSENECVEVENVMKFAGEASKWLSFKAWLEESVEEKEAYNDQQKMQIIQKAVNGTKVQKMLKDADSFMQAKEVLYDWFDTTYKVTQQCYRELKSIDQLQCPSSNSIWSLVEVVDKIVAILVERIPKQADALVVYTIIDKLDRATTRAWERHFEAISISWAQDKQTKRAAECVPDWSTLRNFLNSEAKYHLSVEGSDATDMDEQAIEQIKSCDKSSELTRQAKNKYESQPNVQVSDRTSVQTNIDASGQADFRSNAQLPSRNNNYLKCFVCHLNHMVKNCGQLLSASLAQRIELVERRNLCKKCLQPMHNDRMCREASCNKHCPKCGPANYHNNLLCPKAYVPLAKVDPMKHINEPDSWDEDWER